MQDKSSPPQPDATREATFWDKLFGHFSHEKLAYFFVLVLYIIGTVLTAILIVQVLTWGLFSSLGQVRMVGILISLGSAGLLISRVVAGRYGNRIAALYMPHTLDLAVSARKLMRDFNLNSAKELGAFLMLFRLRVYSSKASRTAEMAADLPCLLEPLFTHNMYLPMMRVFFVRSNRLWFDAREVNELIVSQKQNIQALALIPLDTSQADAAMLETPKPSTPASY